MASGEFLKQFIGNATNNLDTFIDRYLVVWIARSVLAWTTLRESLEFSFASKTACLYHTRDKIVLQ